MSGGSIAVVLCIGCLFGLSTFLLIELFSENNFRNGDFHVISLGVGLSVIGFICIGILTLWNQGLGDSTELLELAD